jgi:hypothetical protein
MPAGPLDNSAQLARAAGAADLALNVTSGTTFVSRLLSPGHYDVITSMFARIIDVPTGRTLADASCRESSSTALNPPTYDELFADQASRLKSLIQLQSKGCLRQFQIQLLNIDTGNARMN